MMRVLAAIATIVIVLVSASPRNNVDCAPTTNSNSGNANGNVKSNNSNNRLLRNGLFSNLFRRQNNSNGNKLAEAASETTTTTSSSNNESDDVQTQTELDAQKFMDSLPNPVSLVFL